MSRHAWKKVQVAWDVGQEVMMDKCIPSEEELYDLAELFKVFGDTTRIRILYELFPGEKCVTDIAESLSMTQSAISHQLRVLKSNRLVRSRRDGKTVYYSLDDDQVRSIIEKGVEHVLE